MFTAKELHDYGNITVKDPKEFSKLSKKEKKEYLDTIFGMDFLRRI